MYIFSFEAKCTYLGMGSQLIAMFKTLVYVLKRKTGEKEKHILRQIVAACPEHNLKHVLQRADLMELHELRKY